MYTTCMAATEPGYGDSEAKGLNICNFCLSVPGWGNGVADPSRQGAPPRTDRGEGPKVGARPDSGRPVSGVAGMWASGACDVEVAGVPRSDEAG